MTPDIYQGYFHPASGKYHIIRRNHTLDGDPKTSSAINAIEEIKYELTNPAKSMPLETRRCVSLQNSLETPKQAARCIKRASQIAESSSTPTNRNEKSKTHQPDFIGKERSSTIPMKNELLQRKQGKIIYRTNSGLLPNYSGYTPGQMFVIGSTWGRSSVNALGKLREQRFQWTSLF
ncbi:uncharacterized protein LOC120947028 isoform X2 [Rana temporaria]|uniref:uncharacterized protein LOC120947028 isoform X2 n=1 Tax=Rana temporaria TaxID=8407 RepID=UPI001AAC467A|nr:uncharacterized protein LOC120947028 isoform X2 [Rana temporaria]